MNQDGIVLSQRDRANLSWKRAQQGGSRRAATRCAGFGGPWEDLRQAPLDRGHVRLFPEVHRALVACRLEG
jgi:hypothetical protein